MVSLSRIIVWVPDDFVLPKAKREHNHGQKALFGCPVKRRAELDGNGLHSLIREGVSDGREAIVTGLFDEIENHGILLCQRDKR